MMHTSKPVNEGSAIFLDVKFRDREKVLVAPVRAWWSAKDQESGATLVEQTELISPASQEDIIVPAAVTLIAAGRDSKTVLITVVAQYGDANDRVSQLIVVPVQAVPGVPVAQ